MSPSRQRLFVGIAGGSCSGKTTLEGGLRRRFGDDMAIIPFDELTIGRPIIEAAGRVVTNWDDPELYRWDDLRRHLADLRAGRPATVDARSLDSRTAGIPHITVEPRPIVALVGYLALYDPDLAAGFDVRVYIDITEPELVRRRLSRPVSDINREPYISATLLPSHRRWVVPQRAVADAVLDAALPPDALADAAAAVIRTART